MSAPWYVLQFLTAVFHLFPIITKFIMFVCCPSGAIHVHFLVSFCSNLVLVIIRSCVVANSSSLSPVLFLSPYPYLPIACSHPPLSVPTFAFQSPIITFTSFLGRSLIVCFRC